MPITTLKRIILGQRFWLFFILPHVIFGAVLSLRMKELIPVLNVAVVALAAGVCAAFFPGILSFFNQPGWPRPGEVLTVGIFVSWFALALNGAWSVVWRYLGQPTWLANTDFISYFRFMAIAAAMMHLLAPGALKEHIPSERWIRIGAITAIVIFGAFLFVLAGDALQNWDAR